MDTPTPALFARRTLVVVEGVVPGDPPHRPVDIRGHPAGEAYGPEDIRELCRARGFPDVDLDNPAVVTWNGGGPDVWA
ncbi:hypothetical protein ABIA33_002103 [Streptacidiphilus sp. MAP12-16]|uniref:hypothetical protein n=1 Tax=Streptacidiphilus sp. MAP12-16 TaxID=3156300 RepID=UPI0035117381